MLTYPQIDPIALSLGPVKVHWYGLMYIIGFAAVWFLGQRRAQSSWSPIKPEAIEDLVTYGAMGVILGGRIGYILFYNFSEFINNPIILFKIWQGGMSFHGGMLGVFIAMWFFFISVFVQLLKANLMEYSNFNGLCELDIYFIYLPASPKFTFINQ